MKVFAVHDSKLGAFLLPFYQLNSGMAVREFTDALKNPKSRFGMHPEDYCLYEIGEFDDEKGTFSNKIPPVSLGYALDFMSSQPAGGNNQ